MTVRGEPRIEPALGTREAGPAEAALLDRVERALLERFALAGYRRTRTPILEPTELHERTGGARLVSTLFTLEAGLGRPLCLRPELTAGIVRAYTALPEAPPLPWRVSYSGPVFRNLAVGDGTAREFHQVGVEQLGAPTPTADAEVIRLAERTATDLGLDDVRIRIGHVGLVRELLRRSELPEPVQVSLVETLCEAAETGDPTVGDHVLPALERHLATLSEWLGGDAAAGAPLADDGSGLPRLYRLIHPTVAGRRGEAEILERLRRKWDLAHGLADVLVPVRGQIHELADLRGPADRVQARLERDFAGSAPDSVAALARLTAALVEQGIALDRVELDLGFGRGLGFYSQMMFTLSTHGPDGAVEICGGGRYDGLAREFGSDRDDRGVGFAFGLERLAAVLPTRTVEGAETAEAILILPQGNAARRTANRIAESLRDLGAAAVVGEPGQRQDSNDSRIVEVGPDGELTTWTASSKPTPTTFESLARLVSGGTAQ